MRAGGNKGFTLIEIMLALLVITVGVVAIIGLLGSSLDSSSKTHDDLVAVSFADMVLNYCHAEPFENVATTGSLTIPDHEGIVRDFPLGTRTFFQGILPRGGFSQNAPAQEYGVTYELDAVAVSGDAKALTLKVWPGRDTTGEPRVFYTELYNWNKN